MRGVKQGLLGALLLHACLVGAVGYWAFYRPWVERPTPGEVLGKAHRSTQEVRLSFSVTPSSEAVPAVDSQASSIPPQEQPIPGIAFSRPQPDLLVMPSRASAFGRRVTLSGQGDMAMQAAITETKRAFYYQRAADFLLGVVNQLQQDHLQGSQIECRLLELFVCSPVRPSVQAFLNQQVAVARALLIHQVVLVSGPDRPWMIQEFSISNNLD